MKWKEEQQTAGMREMGALSPVESAMSRRLQRANQKHRVHPLSLFNNRHEKSINKPFSASISAVMGKCNNNTNFAGRSFSWRRWEKSGVRDVHL